MIRDIVRHRRTTWVVGVLLPLLMLALDPAVFRSTVVGVGAPILGAFKAFGYVATALGVLALTAWLTSGRAPALLGGALAGGALFAGVLGLAILPFSCLGTLFMGVGLLGLSPFLMAVTYPQSARAALTRARQDTAHVAGPAVLGFVLFVTLPGVAQLAASVVLQSAIADIKAGDVNRTRSATTRLRLWRPLLDMDQLVVAHIGESDPGRQQRIAEAYAQLTGGDPAERAGALAD